MFPISGSTAPGGLFTEGSPTGGLPATIVTAKWLNDVQAELLNTITAAGLTPSASVQTQLRDAIIALLVKQFTDPGKQQKGSSDFQVLPGGFILQMGVSANANPTASVTFPTAFPTKVSYVGTSDRALAGTTVKALFSVTAVTLGGFTVENVGSIVRGSTSVSAPGSYGCPWFAIGY